MRTHLFYFFLTLLQYREVEAGQTIILHNYLTHEDIARLTGTTRQTVTTLLGQFILEGIIAVSRKNIVIKDLKLLQKEIKWGDTNDIHTFQATIHIIFRAFHYILLIHTCQQHSFVR